MSLFGESSTPFAFVAPEAKINKLKIRKENSPSINSQKENKGTPLYASLIKASFTIEATVIIPVFLGIMVFGLFFIRVIEVEWGVQRSLNEVSQEIAVVSSSLQNSESQIEKNINITKLAEAVALTEVAIKKNKVPTTYVYGGLTGINLARSAVEGNYIELRADYTVKFPIGLLGKFNINISQVSKSRMWVGYDPSENEWDGVYVYITPFGRDYHKNAVCPYLNPSIRAVSQTELETVRNESGGKYSKCSRCKAAEKGALIYITNYGETYHSDIDCPALKRTVNKVLYETVKDTRAPCPKCGQ